MATRKVLYLLLLAATAVAAPANSSRAGNEPQAVVDRLAEAVDSRAVGRVEIFNVPPDVMNFASYGPADLERAYSYKLAISELVVSGHSEDLSRVLRTMQASPTDDMPDLRWGVILYDRDDNRIGAIYLDKWGARGAVDSTPARFDATLYRWLLLTFGKVFR